MNATLPGGAAADTAAPRPTRPILWVTLLLAGLLSFAGLIALGLWQLERLEWKTALIERVNRSQAAEPVPAPGRADWPELQAENAEYRRVVLRGRYLHDQETLVAATTALGSGYWVLTPLRTDQGFSVLVNRGFVLPAQRERGARGEPEPAGNQVVTGLLRVSEPNGRPLQANDPAAGRWYSRDVAAIAAARGLAAADAAVAPYFVDAVAADDAPLEWPRAGLTVLHFNNNHLGYAMTWFLLAAMMAVALGYAIVTELRAHDRRQDGAD